MCALPLNLEYNTHTCTIRTPNFYKRTVGKRWFSCTMPPVAVAVNDVYAVSDIDKGSLVQRNRSRQSDTNWQ